MSNIFDTEGEFSYTLSNQACGAIMMALQKGIMEQTDITDIIRSFNVKLDGTELIITNPPTLRVGEEEE
jgi:hypothetical protein